MGSASPHRAEKCRRSHAGRAARNAADDGRARSIPARSSAPSPHPAVHPPASLHQENAPETGGNTESRSPPAFAAALFRRARCGKDRACSAKADRDGHVAVARQLDAERILIWRAFNMIDGCQSSRGFFPENQIPNPVTALSAARLKLCDRPVCGARRVTRRGIFKRGLRAEHREHVLGIVLPIGRAVQISARRKPRGKPRNESWLNQAAFMMPRLGPRIGKKNMRAIQAPVLDHLFDDLHGIVRNDADIVQCMGIDPRRIHFDSQKIDMRPAPRYLGGCLPHAKSNFQHAWRFAPEMRAPVKRGKARGRAFCAVRLWMERRYKTWRERFKRTPLSVRQTSGARDKAAHAADLNFRG